MELKKSVFKIALPIFIEMLFFMLLGTIDTLMLNSYNEDAVASVVNANSIINLFTVLLTVVATGIVVVLTKILGKKEKESEGKVVGTGLAFNLFLAICISIILFIIGPILLQTIKADQLILIDSKSYIRIVSFGFIGLGISQACGAIFRSYGKPLVVMFIAMASNVINITLNGLLIFGLFGCPELGVVGAAIGTLTSKLFAAVCALICLYFILGFNLKNISFSKSHLKEILNIGIPSALENFLYNLSQFVIVIIVNLILINGIDGLAVVARAYVLIISNYVMLFSISIANANQIITGYYIGEKNYQTAKEFTIKNFKITLCIVVIVVLILNIFWKQLIGLLTDDETIINSLKGVFLVIFFCELGRTSNIVFIAALRTVSDIIFPVIMGVISMYGLSVLFSYILAIHFNFGLIGVFIAQAMDECFRGTFMFLRWKNKDFDMLRRNDV